MQWLSSHWAANHLETNPSPVVTIMWSWASSLPSQVSTALFLSNDRTIMRMNIKISIVVITETLHWSHWTYFHDNAKSSFALVSHSLWRVPWRFSQAISCEISQPIECRAGQEPSCLEEMYKNVKVPLLSQNCLWEYTLLLFIKLCSWC